MHAIYVRPTCDLRTKWRLTVRNGPPRSTCYAVVERTHKTQSLLTQSNASRATDLVLNRSAICCTLRLPNGSRVLVMVRPKFGHDDVVADILPTQLVEL